MARDGRGLGGIATVVALVVGLAVGYLVGASKAAPPPARADRPIAPARETVAEPRPADGSSLAQALRELPPPEIERGTGTITGEVRMPDGTPVAGVTVRATLRPVRPVEGPPHASDLEDEVKKFVAGYRREQLSATETTTGRDGRYTLSGIAASPYYVEASRDGFRVVAGSNAAWDARSGSTVDFTAEPVVDVTFEVLLPDGSTAPEAKIWFVRGDATTWEDWSRELPRLQLPPASYVCKAEALDGDYASDETELDLPEGASSPPPVVLRLKGRPGIRGAISFARDLPFREAIVGALLFTGDKAPDPALLGDRGKSDSIGDYQGFRYRIEAPRGRYLVGVLLGLTPVATKVVDVADQFETCDFRIDSIDPSLYVVVRVTDQAGKPVTDVTFETGYRTEGDSSNGTTPAAPLPGGGFLVLHYPHRRGTGGTDSVTAKSPRYGEKTVEYQRGEAREVTVQFSEPALLEVTVEGFKSSEHAAGLTVSLQPVAADADDRVTAWMNSSEPDPEGRLRFGPLEEGDYDLILLAGPGERAESLPAATQRVSLKAGKNAVSVPMPALYTLVILDAKGEGSALVLLADREHAMVQTRPVDSSGRADFTPLPGGTYEIRREQDPKGAMRVTLPGPAEVAFKPQPFNAVRVTVYEEDDLAAAGFKDRDLIVAIDGRRFETPEEIAAACEALPTKATAILSIVRGGAGVELRVKPKELFGEGGVAFDRFEWALR